MMPDRIKRVSAIAHPPIDRAAYVSMQEKTGWRMPVELIDGHAVVMPPSGAAASSAQGKLYVALVRWQEAAGDGGLLLQDVFVEPDAGPPARFLAPDVAWWRDAPARSTGALRGMPALAVEVLSPATRANDLGPKRDLYLSAGVQELWLADPEARTVTVITPGGTERTFEFAEVLRSELLPGFAVPLSGVLDY